MAGVVASIVVVGLLGAGIIAAAPWSDDASTAPTTTVPTPTTRPAPTTTERVIDVAAAGPPGFVLDDPSLQLSGAWTVGAEYRPAGTYGNDHFDLWSAPGATRTSGQWLAVAARHAELGYEPTNAGATRVPVGDRVALVTGRDDGAVNITYTSADEITFEVEGFGFALGDMLTIATDLQHGDDGLITYGPMASPLLAGTVQQVSQQVPYGSFGAVTSMWQPRAGAYYQGDDYQTSIEVLLGDSSNSQAALDFLAPPVQLGVADQQVVDALARQGRAITVREVKNWPGALMATWRFPNESLQMQSYGMTVSELVAAAATARLAEPLEWATIIDKSNHGELNVDLPVTQAQPTLIGERAEVGDPVYRVEMMAGTPAMVFLSAERTGWGGPLGDIATEPSVHQFASAEHDVPRAHHRVAEHHPTGASHGRRARAGRARAGAGGRLARVRSRLRLQRAGSGHRRVPDRRRHRGRAARLIGRIRRQAVNRSTPTRRARSTTIASGRPTTLLTLPCTAVTNTPPAPCSA